MMLGPPPMSGNVRLHSFPITVGQYVPDSTTSDGMIGAPAPAPVASVGHMFPLSGETIALLDLQDPGDVQGLHTPAPDLVCAVKGSTQRGSLITRGAKTYEVIALKKWLEGPAGTESWHEAVIQEVVR